jgi:hypothetical protein
MKLHRGMLYSVLALAVTLVGCVEGGVRHGWIMRGQVLALDNGVATVCIGARDGAKVGQVLDVQHITVNQTSNPHGPGPTFTRSDAGQVKITELFDEHYARAQVLAGKPAVNDVVELEVR